MWLPNPLPHTNEGCVYFVHFGTSAFNPPLFDLIVFDKVQNYLTPWTHRGPSSFVVPGTLS